MNLNIMKKRLYVITAAIIATMLIACGKEPDNPVDEPANGHDAVTEISDNTETLGNAPAGENTETDATDDETKDGAEEQAEITPSASEQSETTTEVTSAARKARPGALLEKFILGKYTAKVDGVLYEYLPEGKKQPEQVDRAELVEILALDEEAQCQSISYGQLEVNNTPGDWFCMTIVIKDENDYSGPQTEYVIMCETDTELIYKGYVEDYYRASAGVYDNGVATYGGSMGAGAHGYTSYGIDSEGNFREFYSETDCYYGWSHYEYYGENNEEYTSDLPVNKLMEKFGEQATERMISSVYMVQVRIGNNYYYWPESDGYEPADELVAELAEELGISFDSPEIVSNLEKEAYSIEGIEYSVTGSQYPKTIYTMEF